MSKYDLIILLNEEAELKTIKELLTSLSGKIIKEGWTVFDHPVIRIYKKI